MKTWRTVGAIAAGAAVAFAWRQRRRSLRLEHQHGGFAGPWASPGLGVDDADEQVSGLSKERLARA